MPRIACWSQVNKYSVELIENWLPFVLRHERSQIQLLWILDVSCYFSTKHAIVVKSFKLKGSHIRCMVNCKSFLSHHLPLASRALVCIFLVQKFWLNKSFQRLFQTVNILRGEKPNYCHNSSYTQMVCN